MRIAIYSHSIAPSIDGVCRRFTAILWELHRQNHELILFTLEDTPLDLPPLMKCVTIDHMIIPSYPNKKVARPNAATFFRIYSTIQKYRPQVHPPVSDAPHCPVNPVIDLSI